MNGHTFSGSQSACGCAAEVFDSACDIVHVSLSDRLGRRGPCGIPVGVLDAAGEANRPPGQVRAVGYESDHNIGFGVDQYRLRPTVRGPYR
ncbi:MAG: hypothetical protein JJD93_16545 [Ilumatobacteraceae bacterium]|nr:hypothetical protein [Ilumatobacteraceae bacterium]